jgi:hypothetical protein
MRRLSEALELLGAPPDLRDHVALNPCPTFREALADIVDDPRKLHLVEWLFVALWPFDPHAKRCALWCACALCFELEALRLERRIIEVCWPGDLT